MEDIIQVLPDRVANQIAAGEVVQRPASIVKELLENSIDADASQIQLIIQDAGRTLVQVVDNGKGMSATDARLSFERHATSKIRNAEELFHIQTKGFRGEALASIAAVAHVDLKTKRAADELGTAITIAGSEVTSQEPTSTTNGTSLSVKNLFYNIPARRNFLKGDKVELKHIIDEFERVALAHPAIGFTFHHNNQELFRLRPDGLRKRVVDIFGPKFNEKLVPVEEDTDVVSIQGFVGKPDFAKKSRGEQFFFVNNRFIKNNYLHHAVQIAFEGLLAEGYHPSYFLFLQIDPARIDVNIHPTKTEIKFDDDRTIYAILRSAVKKSLGQYSIAPSLDFERETSFDDIPLKPNGPVRPPSIEVDPSFNPFQSSPKKEHKNQFDWTEAYHQFDTPSQSSNKEIEFEGAHSTTIAYQLHNKYILTHIKTGFMVIDQNRAHQRILYEQFLKRLENQSSLSQQLLFEQTLEMTAGNRAILTSLESQLASLGFDIEPFGPQTVVIRGIPAGLKETNAAAVLEGIIEDAKHNRDDLTSGNLDTLAKFMARNMAVKSGIRLEKEEMHRIVDELFACDQPSAAPNGKTALITLTLEELDKRFQ